MRTYVNISVTVLLALFLALRVVAHPLVLSAPAPGLIALCSNGQIVYFSLETGQPVETTQGEVQKACPFAGLNALLAELASFKLVTEISGFTSGQFPEGSQVSAHRPSLTNTPRAPPAFI